MVAYTVWIHTGEQNLAGTDSNIFIQLSGDAGQTEFVHLPPQDLFAFESGSVDKFVLDVPDVGELRQCCLRHDNSEGDSGWYVAEVRVAHNASGRQWRFVFGQWLGLAESGTLSACVNIE